jgi:hypothetical protein
MDNGRMGWICPQCECGIAPFMDYCPCMEEGEGEEVEEATTSQPGIGVPNSAGNVRIILEPPSIPWWPSYPNWTCSYPIVREV